MTFFQQKPELWFSFKGKTTDFQMPDKTFDTIIFTGHFKNPSDIMSGNPVNSSTAKNLIKHLRWTYLIKRRETKNFPKNLIQGRKKLSNSHVMQLLLIYRCS